MDVRRDEKQQDICSYISSEEQVPADLVSGARL